MLQELIMTVLAEDSVPYESPLLGQHGLSLWVEALGPGGRRRILVDVGQNHEALLYNAERLGIDLADVDAVVLTHCHYDHTKGVTALVRATGRRDLPVIAHPSLFRPHFVVRPFIEHVGVMDGDGPEELADAGARLLLTADPLPLMDGLITTGEVPRQTDFESPGIDLFTLDDAGRLKEDAVMDDLSLLAVVEGQGLVVLTGCSHAGIVNIVRHGLALTGSHELAAVIGGLHLVEADESRIDRTVAALEALHPKLVAAGHCTGFRAQAALYGTFKAAFQTLGSGRRFVISGQVHDSQT